MSAKVERDLEGQFVVLVGAVFELDFGAVRTDEGASDGFSDLLDLDDRLERLSVFGADGKLPGAAGSHSRDGALAAHLGSAGLSADVVIDVAVVGVRRQFALELAHQRRAAEIAFEGEGQFAILKGNVLEFGFDPVVADHRAGQTLAVLLQCDGHVQLPLSVGKFDLQFPISSGIDLCLIVGTRRTGQQQARSQRKSHYQSHAES